MLSNINRSRIEREAQELTLLFPSGTTITRDELASWETLEPQALLARLKACFDPWWAFPKLTPAQIDIFRSVIHPEVVIRASETDLAVLDLRLERNARALGDGHRIVYGVAGSGKTVLLIARAKLLAEDQEKRRWQPITLPEAGFHLGRCRHSCARPGDQPEVRSRSQLPQHRRDPPRCSDVLCATRKRHAGRARLASRAGHRHPLRA